MSKLAFTDYSRYYDLLYRDKDYQGEVSYIIRILRESGICSGNLLEWGSGTGVHGRLLASNGYDVHGIEKSIDMVSISSNVAGFYCEHGDITTKKTGRKYKAIISLFHVISYLTANDQLHAAFSNASLHLDQGGIFVFDFWYSPAVYAQQPTVRVKRIVNETLKVTRIAEPSSFSEANVVDVNYTIIIEELLNEGCKTFEETHSMRHFSLPEIDLISRYHGFSRIRAEEFMTGNRPDADTWGVCVVLKKD